MSDFIPKSEKPKIGGLGPKAQKLQALRDKAAQAQSGNKPGAHAATGNNVKAKTSATGKKASFQRKSV